MLNWLVRYAVVAAILEAEHDVDGSILDVGCGPHGLSCVRPDLRFVGLDVAYPEPVAPTMTAIQAAPGRLPFADAAFETVISLDTLEHMPRQERPAFIGELARVSARRVILACPERRAAPADDLVAAMILEEGQPQPPWLREHLEFGLPSEEEVAAACATVEGFASRPVPTVNALLSLLAVIGDIHPALAADAAEEFAQRAPDWERLFLAGCFGPAARTAWVLTRDRPQPPAVRDAAVLPALRCIACEGTLDARDPDTWACASCAEEIARDPVSGAWVVGVADEPASAPAAAPPPAAPPTADADALRARVTDLESQLARATAQLEHAQGLKIVRYTAPLRTALYRLRSGGR